MSDVVSPGLAKELGKGAPGTRFEYEDLRGWLALAEKLGEVRHVKGASWQEDIGMAAELVQHSDTAPCVVFDDIPGFPKGHRVLTNFFAGRRKNMTRGFPLEWSKLELSQGLLDRDLRELKTIYPVDRVKPEDFFNEKQIARRAPAVDDDERATVALEPAARSPAPTAAGLRFPAGAMPSAGACRSRSNSGWRDARRNARRQSCRRSASMRTR